MEKLLKLSEVEERLAVSRDTLRSWIRQGKIKSTPTAGGHHRISEQELQTFLLKQAGSLPADSVAPEAMTKYRILAVEDTLDSRLMLERCLEVWDARVVGTAYEAWEFAQAESFDLYIIDTQLRDDLPYPDDLTGKDDPTGIKLCRLIRKADPNTPIIFYSAISKQQYIDKAKEAGAQSYILKPNMDILEDTIHKQFEKALES